MNQTDKAEVAERLRWVRKQFSPDQKSFAESLGVDQKRYSNWETGTSRLSLQGALLISDRFGVSLDFLYFGRVDTLSQQMRKDWMSNPIVSRAKSSKEKPN
nr:helix-turn-helix transcriptional regulator [uncultured Cohaesibacter sp.]